MIESVKINQVIDALADPTRRAILSSLASGEMTAGEVARPLKISQPAVSHHLKVLEQAGLIRRRIDAQRRPCALLIEGFGPLEDWIKKLRAVMEQNYTRLDQLLAESNPHEDRTEDDAKD